MSFEDDFRYPIKNYTISELQKVISKSISELVKMEYECEILNIDFEKFNVNIKLNLNNFLAFTSKSGAKSKT
jgi:hypothetical protein